MKNIIAGTAGHIDHGKTALVRALTGIDTDRLEDALEWVVALLMQGFLLVTVLGWRASGLRLWVGAAAPDES